MYFYTFYDNINSLWICPQIRISAEGCRVNLPPVIKMVSLSILNMQCSIRHSGSSEKTVSKKKFNFF
jgi:hypothetical protein